MSIDPETRQQAINLYDRFTHEGMERRAFMAEMIKIAGSAAAAELLIAGIAASPAAAAITSPDDPHLTTRTQDLPGGYNAYVAEPRTRSLKATVLVIHENRGLNDHIRDVARRLDLLADPGEVLGDVRAVDDQHEVVRTDAVDQHVVDERAVARREPRTIGTERHR